MIAPIAEALLRKENSVAVATACVDSLGFSAQLLNASSLIGTALLAVTGTSTTLLLEDTIRGLDDEGNPARIGWNWTITAETDDDDTQEITGEATFEHWPRLHLTLLNVFGRKAGCDE